MIRFGAILLILANGAGAQTLEFPSNANLQTEVVSPQDSYMMPVGVWDGGAIPTELTEGMITRQAWRIEAQALTTLQLLRPLREQVRNARYRIIFECETETCGGFDFRFGTETLQPPEMQISLGDFRFLAARRRGAGGDEYISLFVSRTAQAGFIQVTHVGPPQADASPLVAPSAAPLRMPDAPVTEDLAGQLDTVGHAALADLTFETGSAQLGDQPFGSLQALADYLLEFPDRTVALVGHTDAAGGLEANVALSRRRAASVLERLVTDYGVSRRQLEAEGMGYLSPVASNLTEAGRDANRRVEVVITSTE